MIYNRFLDKKVGEVDAIKGQLDDVTIKTHFLKEPNYTMMLISSCGILELMDKEKTTNYQENNQNIVKILNIQNKFIIIISTGIQLMPTTLQEHSLVMEEMWKTRRWACRVFYFLLADTEVDCRLVLTNLYNQSECSQQEFRKQLSR